MELTRSPLATLLGASLLATALAAAVPACSREKTEATSGAPEAPAPSTSSSAARAPAPSASPSATAGGAVKWAGTYKSDKALMYIPRDGDVPNAKEWDGVKFRGDDAGIGLGDGTITLTLDSATGRVTGTLEGSAGPAVVYGSFGNGRLAATIARRDVTDEGLTGTAVATVSDTVVEGSMRLAESNARVVRVATFSLTKATP